MNTTTEARRWLLEEFASSLALALEGMLGERPAVVPGALSGDGGQTFWRQPFNIGPAAWLAAPEQIWRDIGAKALAAAGIDEADDATAKSTFVEILGQAFSALARSISNRAKLEVTCQDGHEAPPSGSEQEWLALNVKIADGPAAQIRIAFEPDLVAAVLAPPAPAETPPDSPEKRAAPVLAEPLDAANPTTMDLLLDVELPVSVSFGRAQLPLKDVIKLTTGSIVELNRTIAEPVEIIVNNCVIARGEVVVVEGNFGVRIHEVVSRKERLRTLY
jgi:flagellar motor switch protein FliN/FliY